MLIVLPPFDDVEERWVPCKPDDDNDDGKW